MLVKVGLVGLNTRETGARGLRPSIGSVSIGSGIIGSVFICCVVVWQEWDLLIDGVGFRDFGGGPVGVGLWRHQGAPFTIQVHDPRVQSVGCRSVPGVAVNRGWGAALLPNRGVVPPLLRSAFAAVSVE